MARHRSPSGITYQRKRLTAKVAGALRNRRMSLPSGVVAGATAAARSPRTVALGLTAFALLVLVASQPVTVAGPAEASQSAEAADALAEAARDRLAAAQAQTSRADRTTGATPLDAAQPPLTASDSDGVLAPDLSESGGAEGPTGSAAVGGEACPTSGFGGVEPHVAQAGYHLIAVFGLSESDVGGVANRPGNPGSDHPRGLALDFMVGTGTGDALAAYAEDNASALGISYILWQVPSHYDHVHISFTSSPGSGLPC